MNHRTVTLALIILGLIGLSAVAGTIGLVATGHDAPDSLIGPRRYRRRRRSRVRVGGRGPEAVGPRRGHGRPREARRRRLMGWRLARSLDDLRDEVNAAHANRSKVSDGTIGDPAHAARVSDHNPDGQGVVRALDLTHDPAGGLDAHELADRIRLRAQSGEDDRPKYVISNGRIASDIAEWIWRTYFGSNRHTQHSHTSVRPGAQGDRPGPWNVTGETPEDKEPFMAPLDQSTRSEFVQMHKGSERRQKVQRAKQLDDLRADIFKAMAAFSQGDRAAVEELVAEQNAAHRRALVDELVPAIVEGVAESLTEGVVDEDLVLDADAIADAVREELAAALAGDVEAEAA